MMNFMREGGLGMWFILVFGGATLLNAILYARRPDDRRIAIIRMLSTATVFASVSSFIGGIAATFRHTVENPDWAHSPDMPLIVMEGISEASATIALGFSLLTISWLLSAVGARRLD